MPLRVVYEFNAKATCDIDGLQQFQNMSEFFVTLMC